jgi:YgiT-type zinc finger domain-containing protein
MRWFVSDSEIEAVACAACGHPTSVENVAVTLWFGSQLVVVEGVPAHVCPQCRARHYGEEANRRLNSLMASGFPDWKVVRTIEAPVFAYGDIGDFANGTAHGLRLDPPRNGMDFDRQPDSLNSNS